MGNHFDEPECFGYYDRNETPCRKCLCSERCERHTRTKHGLARQAAVVQAMTAPAAAPTPAPAPPVPAVAQPPEVKPAPKQMSWAEAVLFACRDKLGVPRRSESAKAIMFQFVRGKTMLWVAVAKADKSRVRMANGAKDKQVLLSCQADVDQLLAEFLA